MAQWNSVIKELKFLKQVLISENLRHLREKPFPLNTQIIAEGEVGCI